MSYSSHSVAVTLESASSFALGQLAGLFTRAYEGYVVPMRIDEPTLRFIVEAFDLDLSASKVALVDGEPVGFANLGVRGEIGWVGGIGVVAAARRQGFAEALMLALVDEAQRRGVRTLMLEVIEANEPAFRLYEKLGFAVTRWLEIWALQHPCGETAAEEVDPGTAHAAIRERRRAREPWQRADETVAHYARMESPLGGLAVPGGALLYRPAGESVQLVQIAGDETACRVQLSALRGRGPVNVLNLPERDPAGSALRKLGGERRLRQREMTLAL